MSPESDEIAKLAALAARSAKQRATKQAQHEAEARWGEQHGEAVRINPGSVLVGLRGDLGEAEPESLGEGATWEEAFAAAERRCAPRLAQQLAESESKLQLAELLVRRLLVAKLSHTNWLDSGKHLDRLFGIPLLYGETGAGATNGSVAAVGLRIAALEAALEKKP